MQTNKKHIFAAGDVIGVDFSTHTSYARRSYGHSQHVSPQKSGMDYHAIPRCCFGIPEIAVVGKTEHELKITGDLYQTSIAPIGILGKAITSNYTLVL